MCDGAVPLKNKFYCSEWDFIFEWKSGEYLVKEHPFYCSSGCFRVLLRSNPRELRGINLITTELMQNLPSRFGTMVKEELANRPDNTAFTQQRLPAWQPMLSAGIVIPGFLVIGLAFIGIGVALFVTSQSIQVLEVWLQMRSEAISLCFTLNFPSLTSHPEPASLYLKRCGVRYSQRQRCCCHQ